MRSQHDKQAFVSEDPANQAHVMLQATRTQKLKIKICSQQDKRCCSMHGQQQNRTTSAKHVQTTPFRKRCSFGPCNMFCVPLAGFAYRMGNLRTKTLKGHIFLYHRKVEAGLLHSYPKGPGPSVARMVEGRFSYVRNLRMVVAWGRTSELLGWAQEGWAVA